MLLPCWRSFELRSGILGCAEDEPSAKKSSKSDKTKEKKSKRDKSKKKKKRGPAVVLHSLKCNMVWGLSGGGSSSSSKKSTSESLSIASSEACFQESQSLFGLKIKDLQRVAGQNTLDHLTPNQLAFTVAGAVPMLPAADIYDCGGEMAPWLLMFRSAVFGCRKVVRHSPCVHACSAHFLFWVSLGFTFQFRVNFSMAEEALQADRATRAKRTRLRQEECEANVQALVAFGMLAAVLQKRNPCSVSTV